jgi:hypothetical protein
MLNNPNIITLLSIDLLFLFFTTIALIIAIKITLYWDSEQTTQTQYDLEKKSFLAAVAIKYILSLKVPLFVYFIYTLDFLSTFIHGAMCGAGVINATQTGVVLFVIKLVGIYLFALWLSLHYQDERHDDYRYTKRKFMLFIPLALVIFAESIYQYTFFSSLEPQKIVSCCGTLFNAASTSTLGSLLSIPSAVLIALFYGLFALMILFYRHVRFAALANILFLLVSILALITIFSPYIYELPTHQCPFCILQSDYHYIGYLLYSTLFLGTLSALIAWVKKETNDDPSKWQRTSLLFNILYTTILSAYPIIYYIKNGVWL